MLPVSKSGAQRAFRYAPLFIWIGVVLFLSTGQGSMSNTSRVIRPLLEFLFPDASDVTILVYHGYIRKFAHFFEYGMLALLASRAFASSSAYILRQYWHAAAFGLVILIAALDEFNQSFNPDRTASLSDVFLDAAGGLTLIVAAAICFVLRRHQPAA